MAQISEHFEVLNKIKYLFRTKELIILVVAILKPKIQLRILYSTIYIKTQKHNLKTIKEVKLTGKNKQNYYKYNKLLCKKHL